LKTTIFAKLTPIHKERVIAQLRANGHVVGFLGDGINDAPALRRADVGVSVEEAVDVAKESSDIVLLEHNLAVLHDGVVEGRRVFGNVVKYLRMAASSNVGNMLSVTGASLLLPFLPMLPVQIMLNNLLYDICRRRYLQIVWMKNGLPYHAAGPCAKCSRRSSSDRRS
jgi:Mg2+-importing ATPase